MATQTQSDDTFNGPEPCIPPHALIYANGRIGYWDGRRDGQRVYIDLAVVGDAVIASNPRFDAALD